MPRSLLVALLSLALSPGCRGRHREAAGAAEPAAAAREPSVVDLAVGPAGVMRDEALLIAGEQTRVGFRVRGGHGPYRVHVRGIRHAGEAPDQSAPQPLAFDAETKLMPTSADAVGAEAALALPLPANTPSGIYDVTVEVTDIGTRRTAAGPVQVRVMGNDSPTVGPPRPGPSIELRDAGGRRRAAFRRSEQVHLIAHLPGAARGSTATLELRGPKGETLLQSAVDVKLPDQVSATLQVPRFGTPGVYPITVSAAGGASARGRLLLEGLAFPAVDRLLIDRLSLWSGADGLAPRSALLRRGEKITVEARVAGMRGRVAGTVRLRDGRGGEVARAELEAATPAEVGPNARMALRGPLTVPTRAPGRYQLEVEVRDGDHIALRLRDVELE